MVALLLLLFLLLWLLSLLLLLFLLLRGVVDKSEAMSRGGQQPESQR